jgi:hypothetical protein
LLRGWEQALSLELASQPLEQELAFTKWAAVSQTLPIKLKISLLEWNGIQKRESGTCTTLVTKRKSICPNLRSNFWRNSNRNMEVNLRPLEVSLLMQRETSTKSSRILNFMMFWEFNQMPLRLRLKRHIINWPGKPIQIKLEKMILKLRKNSKK